MEGISVMTQLFARGAKVPKQGFFVPMEQKTKIDGVVVHNFRNERIAVECDGGVLSVAVKTSASTAQEWSEAHSRPTDLPRGSDRSNRVSFRVVRGAHRNHCQRRLLSVWSTRPTASGSILCLVAAGEPVSWFTKLAPR